MKHSDDYYFSRIASDSRHPMRTTDPSKAKIFVVPVLINAIAENLAVYRNGADRGRQKICWNGMCGAEILRYADRFLANSSWYRRSNGRDHLLVAGHWNVHRLLGRHYGNSSNNNTNENTPATVQPLRQMNTIRFEDRDFAIAPPASNDNSNRYYSAASTYVGKGCSDTSARDGIGTRRRTHDFAFIANMPPHKFEFRREFCSFLNSSSQFAVVGCGPMHECPALSRAKFGFHMKGDTFGSNRLMNTLLSNTVPILM